MMALLSCISQQAPHQLFSDKSFLLLHYSLRGIIYVTVFQDTYGLSSMAEKYWVLRQVSLAA